MSHKIRPWPAVLPAIVARRRPGGRPGPAGCRLSRPPSFVVAPASFDMGVFRMGWRRKSQAGPDCSKMRVLPTRLYPGSLDALLHVVGYRQVVTGWLIALLCNGEWQGAVGAAAPSAWPAHDRMRATRSWDTPRMSAWESFFVAEVGASAVLAGLVFVGLSINLDKIIAGSGLPGRAWRPWSRCWSCSSCPRFCWSRGSHRRSSGARCWSAASPFG
jgi:hypothetical protein